MLTSLLHLLCILMIMELLLVVFVVYLLMELVTLLEPVTHLGLVLVLVAELSITFLALVVTRIDWTLAVIQLSFLVNLLAVAPLVTYLPFVTFSVCCFSLKAKYMLFSCSLMRLLDTFDIILLGILLVILKKDLILPGIPMVILKKVYFVG